MMRERFCVIAGAIVFCTACGTESHAQSREDDRNRPAARQQPAAAATPVCRATPTSLTPPTWEAAAPAPAADAPHGALHVVADIALPGPANRFDYQTIDTRSGRLYISHMDAGSVVIFNLDSARVVGEVRGTPRATGIFAVPGHHTVYVSAAGAHEVAAIDDRTLAITARVGGIRFPDGIAYAPAEDKVFVSDESGEADVVIEAGTNTKRATIALGGEAGNTHYDSVSHCILVAVQTRNQLVAIDPVAERIVQRYDLPGSDHPHGFTLDEPGRLAFISSEGNALLQVVDLRTMRVLATHRVGDDPDVLAWDPLWRRLYVASESGVVSAFVAEGTNGAELRSLGELHIPHAHTVSVDPRTHRVYLPLESLGGRPILRILIPADGRVLPPDGAAHKLYRRDGECSSADIGQQRCDTAGAYGAGGVMDGGVVPGERGPHVARPEESQSGHPYTRGAAHDVETVPGGGHA